MNSFRFVLLLLVGLLITSTAGAGTMVYTSESVDPEGPMVNAGLEEQTAESIKLYFELAGYELNPVTISGVEYQELSITDEAATFDAGMPDLPYIARSVIIPDDASMAVRVLSSTWTEYENIRIAPSKGNLLRTVDPATVPYEFSDVYTEDRWYPEEIVSKSDPYILRDYRGMVVRVQPVQYNPVQNKIRVHDSVRIECLRTGAGTINVFNRSVGPDKINVEFAHIYADRFLNEEQSRYTTVVEHGEMLIIAYDSFMPAVQPLVDWKNQMGLKTTLVSKSEAGATSTAIKSYIQNVYDNSELGYVLLVGDAQQIPTFTSGAGGSDPTYALLAGSDNYPDIFVGRFSAENTTHVETQVNRTVTYERDIIAGDDWPQRGTGVASNQGPGHYGEYDNVHMGYIRNDLLGYGYNAVDELYDPYVTASQVATAFNDGRGIANYCGHGSTNAWSSSGFSSTHVNQLNNINEVPFICSVACVNGNFTSTTCFAEAWLRATSGGQPTGAIATYMSTVNQGWNPPMYAQDEAIDLLIADEMRTIGGLWYNGACFMMDAAGASGVSEFKNWHIFGDPSVKVRTKAAEILAATHEEVVEPTAESFMVSTGVSRALCCISAGGEIFGVATADVNGDAVIPLADISGLESATLTVTGYNFVPYITAIQVGVLAIPNLVTEPGSFNITMGLDEVRTEMLTITNNGEEGSMLEYSVTTSLDLMSAGWLRITPIRGTVAYGETAELDAIFNTNRIEVGEYDCTITVASNGGEAVIPVHMVAGDLAAADDRDAAIALTLSPASPNPFHGNTAIRFALPTNQPVTLAIYDMSGRLVRTLANGELSAGTHQIPWDGNDEVGQPTSGGIYFYRLNTATEQLTRKVTVLR